MVEVNQVSFTNVLRGYNKTIRADIKTNKKKKIPLLFLELEFHKLRRCREIWWY